MPNKVQKPARIDPEGTVFKSDPWGNIDWDLLWQEWMQKNDPFNTHLDPKKGTRTCNKRQFEFWHQQTEQGQFVFDRLTCSHCKRDAKFAGCGPDGKMIYFCEQHFEPIKQDSAHYDFELDELPL